MISSPPDFWAHVEAPGDRVDMQILLNYETFQNRTYLGIHQMMVSAITISEKFLANAFILKIPQWFWTLNDEFER